MSAAAGTPRRRRWLRRLGWAWLITAALLVVLAALTVTPLVSALDGGGALAWQDGILPLDDDLLALSAEGGTGALRWVLAVLLGGTALLLTGLLLPLLLALVAVLVVGAVGLAGLGVALALMLALGGVGLVVLLLGSPLWLAALLLWWLLRPGRARPPLGAGAP